MVMAQQYQDVIIWRHLLLHFQCKARSTGGYTIIIVFRSQQTFLFSVSNYSRSIAEPAPWYRETMWDSVGDSVNVSFSVLKWPFDYTNTKVNDTGVMVFPMSTLFT